MNNSAVLESLKYDVSERILIVEDIWDSIAKTPNCINITECQKKELDKRLNTYHNNNDIGIPWGTVKKRILERKNV